MGGDIEQKIISQVDASRDEMVKFLQELIAIPSVNPPGQYEQISAFLAERYRQLGLEVELIRVPDELVKEHGLTTPRINVLGKLPGGGGGPCLVLNPHLDTVPPSGEWTTDPFEGVVRDGKVYGRGATDSKGRIATYTYALVALKRAGVKLKGEAIVAATVDEETGGELGPKYLLDHGFIKPDYAIVEGATYTIWIALNGVLHLEITTRGKPAHAATPGKGIDAIEQMHHVLAALYEYRDRIVQRPCNIKGLTHPTLVVGTIEGGNKTNMVPETCTITVDRRIMPGEDPQEVIEEIKQVLAKAEAEGPAGATVDHKVLVLGTPVGPVPEDSPLVQALLKRGEQVLGQRPEAIGIAGFSDSRFYWERGIPVVNYGGAPADLWSSNAHGGDENIIIDDMVKAAKVIALAAVDLLGKAGD